MAEAVVYVRTSEIAHEGGYVVGVFSTLELAQAPETDWYESRSIDDRRSWDRESKREEVFYEAIEEFRVDESAS